MKIFGHKFTRIGPNKDGYMVYNIINFMGDDNHETALGKI